MFFARQRYIAIVRCYGDIASHVDMPTVHLTLLLKERQGNKGLATRHPKKTEH